MEATVSDRTKAFCKGPAHPVYYITLNLNISASMQNFKQKKQILSYTCEDYSCQISALYLLNCGRR